MSACQKNNEIYRKLVIAALVNKLITYVSKWAASGIFLSQVSVETSYMISEIYILCLGRSWAVNYFFKRFLRQNTIFMEETNILSFLEYTYKEFLSLC